MCVCLGYGQTGPQSQTPGYDSIASAVSGMMHITGPEVRLLSLSCCLLSLSSPCPCHLLSCLSSLPSISCLSSPSLSSFCPLLSSVLSVVSCPCLSCPCPVVSCPCPVCCLLSSFCPWPVCPVVCSPCPVSFHPLFLTLKLLVDLP